MNKKRRCLMLIAMSLSLFSCNSKKTVFPDYMYEEDNEVMDEYSLKDVNNFKSEKEDINKAFKDNYVDDINLINKDTITYGELFLANKRCDNLAYISNNEEDAHYIFYANNKFRETIEEDEVEVNTWHRAIKSNCLRTSVYGRLGMKKRKNGTSPLSMW